MSRWNADSDLDYYDECNGPYATTVDVVCANCRETFPLVLDRDNPVHPWCDRCVVLAREGHVQPTKASAA